MQTRLYLTRYLRKVDLTEYPITLHEEAGYKGTLYKEIIKKGDTTRYKQ